MFLISCFLHAVNRCSDDLVLGQLYPFPSHPNEFQFNQTEANIAMDFLQLSSS